MSKSLIKLVENFGSGAVMANFVEPVSKYYAEKNILRDGDETLIAHMLPFEDASQENILKLASSLNPNIDIPLGDVELDAFVNDFLKMLCQCCTNYPSDIETSKDLSTFNILTEEAQEYVQSGVDYVSDMNKVETPLLEAVDTDQLVDKVLSDLEVELLYKLQNPKATNYKKEYRDEIKKSLKDPNSPAHRILKSSYLKESSFGEISSDLGTDVIKNVQKKSIVLTENAGHLVFLSKTKKGYSILKYKQ